MKVKFGAIVTDGRGKIGGHVASKNRAGSYFRTKVTPVNRQSAAQVAARAILSSLSAAWRGLTEARRLAWNAAVENYSKTDIFGDIRNPTGLNLYVRLNASLAHIGVAALADPPSPASVAALSALSVTQAAGAATSVVYAATPVPADHVLVFEATSPQSAGKSFVKSEYRVIGQVAAAAASPYVATADYAAKFGGPGAVGEKVFIRAKLVNMLTGQAGAYLQASTIVT